MSDLEPTNPATVPAVPTPTDLDGWTSDDVLTHLANLVVNFKRGRIEVGLLLWKLRTLEPDDASYGRKAASFADKFDVTTATLRRWRQSAEDEFGLVRAVERAKHESAGQEGEVARGRAVVDVESRSADKAKSNNGSGDSTADVVEPDPPPSAEPAAQLRLWPDDPVKAMFASFDVVLDQLGPEETGKYVATFTKRIERATPKPPTVADEPIKPVACAHPKKSEQHKGWGVLCGDCKQKIR